MRVGMLQNVPFQYHSKVFANDNCVSEFTYFFNFTLAQSTDSDYSRSPLFLMSWIVSGIFFIRYCSPNILS